MPRKDNENEINMRGECTIRTNSNNENGGNQERANEEEVEARKNEVREVINIMRQICREIKVKGSVNKKKYKGLTRMSSENYNGFGPISKYKIDRLVRDSNSM